MSVEASPAQLAALRDGDPAERVALLRLVRAKDPAAYGRWLETLDTAVHASGGQRRYRGAVDAVLTDPALALDELIVDEFPSRELAAESLRVANPHAGSALADAFVLAARPRRLPAWMLRGVGLWLRLRGASRVRVALPADTGNRAIDPSPEAFGAFLGEEPSRPLYVLNLNRHRDRAAYGRYGRNTLPHLLRRRAGPVFAADALPALDGAASHPLREAWDEILLVRYPSRAAMLDMLRDPEYQRGLPDREQGLARAALVATCPLPGGPGHYRDGPERSLAGGPAGETS